MSIKIGLLDGTAGQAGVFREALEKEFALHAQLLVHSLHSEKPQELSGLDILFVFPNDWDAAISSYQEDWAGRAKAAGVKIFVPFEFGNPTGFEQGDPPVIQTIAKLLSHCKSIKQDVLRVHTGPAMDVILPGILRIDHEKQVAKVIGRGDTPISFVTSSDVARVTAIKLLNTPLAALADTTIRATGDPKTYNEVLGLVSSISKKEISIDTIPLEDIKESLPIEIGPPRFLDWLMAAWEEGRAYLVPDPAAQAFGYQSVEETLRVNIGREAQ